MLAFQLTRYIKLRILKLIAISLSSIPYSAGVNALPMPHIAQPSESWVLQPERSDEFDIKNTEN
ncbi:hypothetical protein PC2016_3885 (plasmid) [Pseudoalteromonas carrageenovora]|nr:hypothetical protein PC2016_3885 [Pseudoalteromonas carrageenovora]